MIFMLLEYVMDQVHIKMVLYMLIDYTYFLFIILMYFLPLKSDYVLLYDMHACIYKNGIYSPKQKIILPWCLHVIG